TGDRDLASLRCVAVSPSPGDANVGLYRAFLDGLELRRLYGPSHKSLPCLDEVHRPQQAADNVGVHRDHPAILTRRPGMTGCSQRTAPRIHGLNSSSPTPASSLFVRLPEATARTLSKISSPTASRLAPSSTWPAFTSMSGSWLRYSTELLAILIDGAGLKPNADPLPVVKTTTLQPPATCPVTETGS